MAKFLKFIVNTIMIVAIVVAAALLIPPFAGVTTLIVDDIEMATNLKPGSVTYAWGVDAGELTVGNKVLLQEEDNVYEISSISGTYFVLEDKLSTDGGRLEKEFQGTIQKVILTVPYIGYVAMALRTMEGLIIVGLSVVFVIILFILAEIWRKEEEDDDEDETDTNASKSDGKEAEELETIIIPEVVEPTVVTSTVVKVQEPQFPEEEFSKEETELFKETTDSLAADIVRMIGLEAVAVTDTNSIQSETLGHTFKNEKETVLAMPSYTKDELMERAKVAGDNPELVMDEISGVTFLDYSDIL